MSKEKVYADGIRIFPPHQNAPDFVKGTIIITWRDLNAWCTTHPQHMTEYNGNEQIKLQLLEGDKGLYTVVDTYGADGGTAKKEPKQTEDLPF